MHIQSMQKYKKKGNIAIMVLFILALISLWALLSTNHVRHIINTASALRNYYSAYYIAKAWVETSLVAVDHYAIGFEETIDANHSVNQNFSCKQCYFSGKIVSRTHHKNQQNSTYLTNNENESECSWENAISLQPQETYSIPLFYDISTRWDKQTTTSMLASNIHISLENIGTTKAYAYSLALGDGALSYKDRHKLTLTGDNTTISLNSFLHELHLTHINTGENINNQQELIYTYGNQTSIIVPISKTFNDFTNYLLITNNEPSNSNVQAQFCIQIHNTQSSLTRWFTSISSLGTYNATQIGLGAKLTTQIPDFLFSTFIQR